MLWTDFETGGLDPQTASPLEVAVVQTDRDGNVLRWFESKIKPCKPVDPKAAAVNGYTEEKWKDAPNLVEVKLKISQVFNDNPDKKYMAAGWNISFDMKWWEHYGFGLKFGYHPYDLFGAIFPRFRILEKIKLEQAYKALLGKEPEGAHTALGDCRMCIELYRWNLERLP